MGSSVFIGKVPQSYAVYVERFLQKSSLRKPTASPMRGWFAEKFLQKPPLRTSIVSPMGDWFGDSEAVAIIDTLNVASLSFFLEYTACLEGLTPDNAINKSRWSNLPYWIECIWLPVSEGPKASVQQVGGMPTLLATSSGLLADLAEVKAKSTVQLDVQPKHFDLMQRDLKAFYQLEWEDLGEEDTLRWIWSALFVAANLANEHQLPAMSG